MEYPPMEAVMKKIIAVLFIMSFALIAGCSTGEAWLTPVTMDDFIGDWFMTGTLVLDIEGRQYTTDIDRVVYIRDGYIVDTYGYGYTPRLANGMLMLTRNEGFSDYDPYCGYFEGGTALTYTFVGINPFFKQSYEGSTQGETAVFTQHCNYKQATINGVVYLERTSAPLG
jgi:hypothetical protein